LLALIDADLLVYRVGWTTLADPEEIAFYRMDEMIRGIQEALQTAKYKAFLTASGPHYRHEIYPEYKANRKAEKPTHYHRLRDYLLETHGAELVLEQEADDALGINQMHPETCIVTIDKDLDQIAGWHYNFVKKDLYEVTPDEGLRYFYQQLLMGDRIDNIPGIYGIGPVNAARIIGECKTEKEMYDAVKKHYEKASLSDEALIRNGQLLKIRTREGELWQPPNTEVD
jgi:5'-3' exonuclease